MKNINQTKFKVGDRVKYESYVGVDYGNIVEVNGSIYYNQNREKIWVKWDSDGKVLHLLKLDMTLVQSASNYAIIEKITQIEQQLQELKELLKD